MDFIPKPFSENTLVPTHLPLHQKVLRTRLEWDTMSQDRQNRATESILLDFLGRTPTMVYKTPERKSRSGVPGTSNFNQLLFVDLVSRKQETSIGVKSLISEFHTCCYHQQDGSEFHSRWQREQKSACLETFQLPSSSKRNRTPATRWISITQQLADIFYHAADSRALFQGFRELETRNGRRLFNQNLLTQDARSEFVTIIAEILRNTPDGFLRWREKKNPIDQNRIDHAVKIYETITDSEYLHRTG